MSLKGGTKRAPVFQAQRTSPTERCGGGASKKRERKRIHNATMVYVKQTKRSSETGEKKS